MQLLDFRLPNFCRIAWASNKARQVWDVRLKRISKAWHEIEWLSVADNLRSCAICQVIPEELPKHASRWLSSGLYALPLQISNAGHYSTYAAKVDTSKAISVRLVVGKPESLVKFQRAWDEGDQLEIGRLLGYPSCCSSFFEDVWVTKSQIDTTWSMCGSMEGHTFKANLTNDAIYANILWRWMGVRFVPHLPCSFDCTDTCQAGRSYEQILRKYGYGNEANWMQQILSWPVEWSALHGIAEIKTPILKVSTNTDPTGVKYTVRLEGLTVPEEKGGGSTFPWNFTPLRGSDALLSKFTEDELIESNHWYASDNGFNSHVRMHEEHEKIVSALQNLTELKADSMFSIIDLGCGNGALLKKIKRTFPGASVYGIDNEGKRLGHASLLHPKCEDRFKEMNMFNLSESDFAEHFDFALLMPGRLREVAKSKAEAFLTFLKSKVSMIVVYAYADTLNNYRNISHLCESVRLKPIFIDGSVGLIKSEDITSIDRHHNSQFESM